MERQIVQDFDPLDASCLLPDQLLGNKVEFGFFCIEFLEGRSIPVSLVYLSGHLLQCNLRETFATHVRPRPKGPAGDQSQ